MCGLVGILFAPVHRSDSEWRALADIFTANLLANEERGREAAGIALVRSDGNLLLHRAQGPASDLTASPSYQKILAALNGRAMCLLGHTRAPTKGAASNNENNHPILAGNVVGIHNGHIRNDDRLFTHFHLPRRGEVDSEIIFRLLDLLSSSSPPRTYLQDIAWAMSLLEGPLAVLAVNLQTPTRLLVAKDGSPLCVHYEPRWQALFFSSRYAFLRRAFGSHVITEVLPAPRVMLFEADRLDEMNQLALERFPLVSTYGCCRDFDAVGFNASS